MKRLILIIGIIFIYSISYCQSKRQNFDLDSNVLYFPVSFFPVFDWTTQYEDSATIFVYEYISGKDTTFNYSKKVKNIFDTAQIKRYSKYLFAMNEPIIKKEDSIIQEIYRFLWLRTFNNPILIKLENNNNQYKLYWKKTNGYGGYYPGKITTSKEKIISRRKWNRFKELLNSSNFWEEKNNGHIPMSDGVHWILEGSKNNIYNVYDSTFPLDECKYLLKLAKIKIKARDIY